MENKKVGLLTLPYEPNYGWMLQLWALYHTLQNEGFDVTVLDRRWNDDSPSKVKDLKRWVYYNIFCGQFTRFFNSNFIKTKPLRSSSEMSDASQLLEAVVVGSDQVWRIEHTRGADLNFFLDFLQDRKNVKRISYAASFGNDRWSGTEEETKKITQLLSQFDLISVRESSGVELCSDYFKADSVEVLDPTMLLTKQYYINELKLKNHEKNTLVTYILDYNNTKQALVNSVATNRSLSVVELYPKKRGQFSHYKSINYWLESILNANSIIIDSFHGMVFSILFNKNFVVLGNEKRGMARFLSLLKALDLESRLIIDNYNEINHILDTPIGYGEVNERLNELGAYSKKVLFDALKCS